MYKLFSKGLLGTLFCAQMAIAAPVTYDFSAGVDGTPVTNQYAGIVFSLSGGPADDTQPPILANGGLANTPDGNYPTANFLVAAFTSPVSGLAFVFNNEGDNGGNTYFVYDALNNLLASAPLTGDGSEISYDLSGLNNVSRIEWDNGQNGQGNWTMHLTSITFDAAAQGAPELSPSSAAMPLAFLCVSLALVEQRRRNSYNVRLN